MDNIQLVNGDCIDEMNNLIDKDIKVDLVLTDPPYGTTACKWDTVIPFEPMWECINGLSNKTTPTLLFGSEPFSSNLRMSNIKNYKYDWVWDKIVGTGFLSAKRRPLMVTEQILVFYKKLPKYNPVMRNVEVKYDKPVDKGRATSNVYDTDLSRDLYVDNGKRYPLNLLRVNGKKGELSHNKRVHPTQKPVELLEYLIKTYTNEEDLVLDFTMGSGSTGVACRNLNRKFIGIELNTEYFNIAKDRINNCQTKLI